MNMINGINIKGTANTKASVLGGFIKCATRLEIQPNFCTNLCSTAGSVPSAEARRILGVRLMNVLSVQAQMAMMVVALTAAILSSFSYCERRVNFEILSNAMY